VGTDIIKQSLEEGKQEDSESERGHVITEIEVGMKSRKATASKLEEARSLQKDPALLTP
jgi:hypothetical protein